jgi:outer membrane receptor protein involved in Fe transport
LAEVLAELQLDGLNLVFSSAVVGEGMVVLDEPLSTDPRGILDEILRGHDLLAREAPGGGLVIVRAADLAAVQLSGTIRGVVAVRGAPDLLDDVSITVEGSPLATRVSRGGRFALEGVPAGVYTVVARSPVLTPQRQEGVRVGDGDDVRIAFELTPAAVFLDELVVTPSHFRILEDRPESRQYLSRREVEQMPHAADDLYRAIKRLPGAAGGDYSASFNVRGGEQGELLVLLDGARLYEPFHLKDFQSVFSIIDSETVGGVDLLTGGFPVEFGDRMSGVMDIAIAPPPGPLTTTLAAGTLNSRLLSAGFFDEDRGTWLASARAWYPGSTADLVTDSPEVIRTHYYDLFLRLDHQLGAHSTLSGDLLAAFDDLGYRVADEEETEQVEARYASYQLWSNLGTGWTPSLYSDSVVSLGRLTRDRDGDVEDVVDGTLVIDDQRSFDSLDLRQAWTWAATAHHLLKWGFDISVQEATYDYLRREVEPDGDGDPAVEAELDPSGTSYGLYLADRLQPVERLIIEIGLRWDDQSWLAGSQTSPRIQAMLAASPRTTVRAAWGRYFQSQRLNELQIEDGVTEFSRAQRADHWLASVEHDFEGGFMARFEVYEKDFEDLRPRYENQFGTLDLFPEALDDRILLEPDRGRARGVELFVKHATGRSASWWLSYVLATAEDRVDGRWQPRNWDQRHALSLGLNFELPRHWNLNVAGLYHSGWPTTDASGVLVEDEDGELVPELVLGPRNAARLPSYHRIDVRATKRLPVHRGELSLILEVLNLFDVDNVCCVEDFEFVVGDDGTVVAVPQQQYWAPIIPSVGIQYRF